MAEKEITRVSITNETLKKTLSSIIVKGESKENLVLFFEDLMKENPIACEHFINFVLGGKFPELPEIGKMGYIKLDCFWGEDREYYSNSPFCKNGYVMCFVTKVRSISQYNPLVVIIPGKGKTPDLRETSVHLKDFYPEEGLILDKLIY